MMSITSRQVAPFQALLNMIKINYFGKSEVFHALIAILCDYEPGNPNNISKTKHYIHVLLSGNLDLAECLISFLPPPTTQPEVPFHHDMHHFTKFPYDIPDTQAINLYNSHNPGLLDIKPLTDKQYLWCPPTIKEGSQNTGFTITASIRDEKVVTASEFGYDNASPHPRPLTVPNPGGTANHYHVIPESEPGRLSILPRSTTVTPNLFTVPLAITECPKGNYNFPVATQAEDKTAVDVPVKNPRCTIDPWVKQYETRIPTHPLLKPTVPVINDNMVTNTLISRMNSGVDSVNLFGSDPNLNRATVSGREQIMSQAENLSFLHALGSTTPCTQTHPQVSQTSPTSPTSKLATYISPEPAICNPIPLHKPLGLCLPLPKPVNQGVRTMSTANPALSHLLGMTKVSLPTSVQELQKISNTNSADEHLSGPSRKVARLTTSNTGRESLTELRNKLKDAEKKLKQSQQYAKMIQPVLQCQPPIPFSMPDIPYRFINCKQQCLDQGTTRNLTSFPYIHRIILPDGDVRTLNIDSSKSRDETSTCEYNTPTEVPKPKLDDNKGSNQRRRRKYKFKVNKRNKSDEAL